MNSRAQLVRRLCGDLVQRLRIALGSSGEDSAKYVDQLDRSVVEQLASDVCNYVGIEYESPPEPQSPKSDGKKGWQARAKSGWKQELAYSEAKNSQKGK